MTALLLDTTFLVDTERDGIDLDTLIDDDDDVAVAAITIAELLVGVILATGKRRVARQAFVEEAISSIPILAYDHAVAIEHAELLMAVRIAGRPRGGHDLIIAATARAARRTVVTIDAAAFSDLPGVAVRSHR
ncbi:MAG: PIN domain-containing protein [Actinomycetota bacterium]|nr:PIN domain-containing protein [Actinomycetota bacterium]